MQALKPLILFKSDNNYLYFQEVTIAGTSTYLMQQILKLPPWHIPKQRESPPEPKPRIQPPPQSQVA